MDGLQGHLLFAKSAPAFNAGSDFEFTPEGECSGKKHRKRIVRHRTMTQSEE
jgi:hypothetical protein